MSDFDERNSRINQQLLSSEKKFRMLFEKSPVGMAMVDYDTGVFLEANDALLKSLGYSLEELLNLTFWDITPAKYHDQEKEQMKQLDETGSFGPYEKVYIGKDGKKFPISMSAFIFRDIDERIVVWRIIEDISDRKQYEEEIKKLALYDPLTKLPNRRLLSNQLKSSFAQCRRDHQQMAILLLDLDHFKVVNDQFGHQVGDLLLIEAANRIKGCVLRSTDTVARLGGDEFIISLPNIKNINEAEIIADKICDALREPMTIEGNFIKISASIGISIFPLHGENEKTLIRNSDIAMYKAKYAGGNTFKYFSSKI